jgi:general secretion pathway protein E/type IV pilus assembly protein PilB
MKRAGACNKCHHTGYRGRSGIFEVLEINDTMRDLIKTRATKRAYAEAVRDAGLVPLREAALKRAQAGVTSLEEVLRVT